MAHSGLAGSTKKPRSPGKMRASTEQVKTKSVETTHQVCPSRRELGRIERTNPEPMCSVGRVIFAEYRKKRSFLEVLPSSTRRSSRLVQVSKNPFVTTLEARLRCAQHNIDPNF